MDIGQLCKRYLTLMLISGASLGLLACGGSSESDSGVARVDDAEAVPTKVATVQQVSQEPIQATAEAFTACMTIYGFDLPPPALNDDGTIDIGALREAVLSNQKIDLKDKSTRDALTDCAPELVEANDSAVRTDEDITTDFTTCMRKNGFSIPDPEVKADGTVDTVALRESVIQDPKFDWQDPKTQEVLGECLPLLQGATFTQEDSAEEQVEFQDNLLKFAECLRADDVPVSDPDFSGGTRSAITSMFAGIDTQDAKVQASIATCREVYFGD
mgnify:FL=1